MTLKDKVVVAKTLFTQSIDDEIVILDTQSEEYFGLDEMGAVMWEELRQSGSLEKLFNSINEAYDVDMEQLKVDILHFVQSLADAGLVQIESK